MKVNKRIFGIIAIAYIYIPIFAFLWGFTRWYYALITSGILIWGLREFIKEIPCGKDERDQEIFISIPVLTISFASIIIICIILGIGGFFPQAGDWYKHNAVLNDLTKRSWPVYYEQFGKSMLTYYLGQYLVPALIGKMVGSSAVSNASLTVISIFGLFIVYILLCVVTGADDSVKQISALFIMLFFCGALNLTQNILTQMFGEKFYSLGSFHWILYDNILLQYRSNTVMIRWVLPQIIVPWLGVLLFMEYRRKTKFYVLIILPSLLFGSFSFATLAAVALVEAICGLLKHNITYKGIFGLTNLLPALSLGSILFFYFLGNVQVEKPISSSFRFQIYKGDDLAVYIVFCLIMFGVYAACVFKENRRDVLWYSNLFILLFLPWCRMGLCNDVVMSGSIPSLFILMIMICRLLFDERESTMLGIRKGIVIAFLLIGCIYPVREIADNIKDNNPGMELADSYPTMMWFTDRADPDISEDLRYNYYTYDLEGKIFYEYIARTKGAK